MSFGRKSNSRLVGKDDEVELSSVYVYMSYKVEKRRMEVAKSFE